MMVINRGNACLRILPARQIGDKIFERFAVVKLRGAGQAKDASIPQFADAGAPSGPADAWGPAGL